MGADLADALDLVMLLASHCRVAVQDHGSVMLSLFATGLIGSFTHCTTMCGPLVAAQSVEVLGRMPPGRGGDDQRLHVPYHDRQHGRGGENPGQRRDADRDRGDRR